jgi:serine-type D-Ala-D-Ala carboxypeptidase/endopeptidase (penicillin-binding protein 4)
VRGNLYMVGGGDPLLTTDTYEPRFVNGVPPLTDLETVADQIVGTGISEVTGSVVGDGSRYDADRSVPSWPERFLTQGQVAPLSALLVNDGWTVDPIRPGPGAGPTTDPDLHAASVMTALLVERGVNIAGAPATGRVPEDASTLIEVPSLTIAELVGQLLAFADNTTTEMLVKELGVRSGAGGSTEAGLTAVRDWIDRSGLDGTGVVFDDGAGLSENDRLTCTFLASLLAADGPDGPVAEGLARPGEAGTLDDRLLEDPLPGAVRAKTGTLRSVAALSGWVRTNPGSDLAFSFVVNPVGRTVNDGDLRLQRDLLLALTDHPRTPPLETLSPVAAGPPR